MPSISGCERSSTSSSARRRTTSATNRRRALRQPTRQRTCRSTRRPLASVHDLPDPGYRVYRRKECMRLADRRTELRLAADAIAPALARAGVHHITSELPEGAAADVELLMTEVVSNAVRHASTSSA